MSSVPASCANHPRRCFLRLGGWGASFVNLLCAFATDFPRKCMCTRTRVHTIFDILSIFFPKLWVHSRVNNVVSKEMLSYKFALVERIDLPGTFVVFPFDFWANKKAIRSRLVKRRYELSTHTWHNINNIIIDWPVLNYKHRLRFWLIKYRRQEIE